MPLPPECRCTALTPIAVRSCRSATASRATPNDPSMSARIAPLSPTDANPLVANAAVSVVCMHPNSIERQWPLAAATRPAAVGATSSAPAAAMSFPTLPLCASVYSDAEGRELLPFACAVSADSYRQMLLQNAPPSLRGDRGGSSDCAANSSANSSAALVAAQSYAAPAHIPLSAADVSLLGDALLCNSSLTSLSLDHCGLDADALPPLCTLLQQHPSITSLSLAGNLLGLHPDSEDLRALFSVLASPAALPHLAQLNLANKSDKQK